MATNGTVGAVVGLWRFPVKSKRGERLAQAEFTEHGLMGTGPMRSSTRKSARW